MQVSASGGDKAFAYQRVSLSSGGGMGEAGDGWPAEDGGWERGRGCSKATGWGPLAIPYALAISVHL